MRKRRLSLVTKVLVLIGVLLYIFGGIYGWQSLSIQTNDETKTESFSPLGLWLKEETDNMNISVLLPFPSEALKNNSERNFYFVGHPYARAEVFNVIWMMYLVGAVLIFILGVARAARFKKLYLPLTLGITFIMIFSLAYFFFAYPSAFESDLTASNLPSISPFNGEEVDMDYTLSASLSPGFFFYILSLIFILGAGVVEEVYVTSKSTEKSAQKKAAPPPKKPKEEEVEEESTIERMTIECPNCGNVFEVEVDMSELPVTVQCPYCGMEGEIG